MKILIALFLILLILTIVLICNECENKEHYGLGGLTQLRAKGPQDLALTTGIEKYLYPYWYNYPYPYTFFWNNSTRYPNYIPNYLYYDDYIRTYPYVRYY